MILYVDSDATYLVLLNIRSRIARYYFLFNYPKKTIWPTLNGEILVECKALHYVISLFTKVEIVDVFYNAQITILIWYLLESLRHSQPAIPIKTSNSTTADFVYNNIY